MGQESARESKGPKNVGRSPHESPRSWEWGKSLHGNQSNNLGYKLLLQLAIRLVSTIMEAKVHARVNLTTLVTSFYYN
jgi:hypothetical protein